MARIVVFMPNLAGGGAERVTLALCKGLIHEGHHVQLVVSAATGPLSDEAQSALGVADLRQPRVFRSLPGLVRLLNRQRPAVVISVLSHANLVAALAVRLSGCGAKLIVMHHNTMSINVRESPRWRDRLMPALCGLFYPMADVICSVSEGVASDLSQASRIPRPTIRVLPNPVDYSAIQELGSQDVPAGVIPDGDGPLILAVGRLEKQKDFATLIRAVAALPGHYRLVILGDGSLRPSLQALIDSLGIASRVSLPGYLANPYPVYASADVFALSSLWEGLPTVLLEAMAFDLPLVSTDCRSGPREILRDGEYGTLVPVGDAESMTRALEKAANSARRSFASARANYDLPYVCSLFNQLVLEVTK